MMIRNCLARIPQPPLRWTALAVFAAIAASTAGGAQRSGLVQVVDAAPVGTSAVSPLSPPAPPELIKPALPSELPTAESVFRKLDVGKRGYLTLDDTKDLIGFEKAFRSVDTADSGRLNPKQFRKAWALYKKK